MKQPLHIWLNIAPFTLGAAERAQIEEAASGAVIHYSEGQRAVDPDQFDGAQIDVLVAEGVPRNLASWPRLRFVQLMAAGTDYLDGHPIWKANIPVATARGIHSVPIAEHITAMLLMLSHQLPQSTQFKATRTWPDRFALASHTIRGRTVGIMGYGAVGAECARQLDALGMHVVCLKRRPEVRTPDHCMVWPDSGDPEGRIPQRWFGPDQLHEMLPLCDVLVVIAAKNAQTAGSIGRRELNMLRPGARVIIASRGGIVDEQALAEALHSGVIVGAAVDTFSTEPPPTTNPLFDAPNLIATPHIAGSFKDYWPMVCRILCENLRRLRAGQPPVNLTRRD